MELLCEKTLSSSNAVLSPGDGLRRVFEGISSGLLLPGGPGLLDPCEKDPVDAAAYLTAQQREDITASAQVKIMMEFAKSRYWCNTMMTLSAHTEYDND